MKKTFISFMLLFMCLPLSWATSAFAAEPLAFELPVQWEYNNHGDMLAFTIVNHGEAFDGVITLCAKSDETELVYEVFAEGFSVEAGARREVEYRFLTESGLPVGTYSLFFSYVNAEGQKVTFVPVNKQGIVRAPSSVTRIPITTTTTVPGGKTISAFMAGSDMSLISSEELESVDIVNMAGQTIHHKKVGLVKEVTFQVGNLNSGKYIVVGRTKKGLLTTKIFKVK